MGLAYALDSKSEINLIGDNGQCGTLSVGLIPCNQDGSIHYENDNYNEEMQIEDPNDLLNKRLDFKVIITEASLPQNFCMNTYVEYYLMNLKNVINKYKTQIVQGKNNKPKYNYEYQHTYKDIDIKIIKYLSNNTLQFKVFGQQDIV